ncbi:uncharacterized protein EKO05_0005416 [Ascochyta rabiei]|uniref:Hydrolase n=1 Tax=Didymella rabiei TaxID=5454 RepID=A0A163JST2_DIDRA|nr:uncharacterized protein EKO05_0005416 [Ascochyta rabiei]KZM26570.1 hydrolase [Ascochyta rabiei]UPX14946.1 hypothetical protein EKO05_0005416 [Ascochyta rabiei]
MYSSETKDLRAYAEGWDAPEFGEDDQWKKATPVTSPRGKLKSQKTFELGTAAFDTGQNMTTTVKLQVRGPAGAEVLIRFPKTIDNEGRVLMPNPIFQQFETGVFCKYTLPGNGILTWEPDFCVTSAQYTQVESVALESKNPNHLRVVVSLDSRPISSAARRLGCITTDKDDENQPINVCYCAFIPSFFSYHTDCPQIEEFGWPEATHLLAPATQYIRHEETLYTETPNDIVEA